MAKQQRERAKPAPDTIEVDALLQTMAERINQNTMAAGSILQGIAEVCNRLGGVEKALSQHSFVTIAAENSPMTATGAKISRPADAPMVAALPINDRLNGILEGLIETRNHLHNFICRLGFDETQPPGIEPTMAPTQNIYALVDAINNERHRIRDLVSDLASRF